MKTLLSILLLAPALLARPCLAAEELIATARFGTELIVMQGGISAGDPCEAFGYHGYNGIERETMDAIKQWIRRGP